MLTPLNQDLNKDHILILGVKLLSLKSHICIAPPPSPRFHVMNLLEKTDQLPWKMSHGIDLTLSN